MAISHGLIQVEVAATRFHRFRSKEKSKEYAGDSHGFDPLQKGHGPARVGLWGAGASRTSAALHGQQSRGYVRPLGGR